MASGPVVLDSVVDEIHGHFPEHAAAAPDFVFGELAVDGHLFVLAERIHEFHHGLD